ncbi:uncharacterized protein LOC119107319 [Pollicipes pollicipes]|uniref:uncharacterized protein LOC119107319 n=1 Tax=Pollicipes pollicipes TaxID=41117 RepID=UPI0018850CC2|nr:uncharacterized protein LOC119107319 [Pollicipes pollicipes]
MPSASEERRPASPAEASPRTAPHLSAGPPLTFSEPAADPARPPRSTDSAQSADSTYSTRLVDPADSVLFTRLGETRLRRLVHPLDEGILCSFVRSLLVVVCSLTVGICLTLAALLAYPAAAAGRRLGVLCSASLRRLSLKRRLEMMANLVGPHDVQWLEADGGAASEPIHHALLLFDEQFRLEAALQRIVPFAGGRAWVADDEFVLENHMFAAPAPVSLERSPWEAVAVHVAATRETAVLVRVHHVISDGMGLLRALCHVLADTPPGAVPPKANFGSVTYALNCLRALFVTPVTLAQWLVCARSDVRVAREPWRTDVCLGSLDWEHLNQVKHVTKQSVHEILLSVVAGAVRRELKRSGLRLPPNLTAVIPVDLRRHEEPRWRLRLNNCCSLARVALPTRTEGAVPRLWAARRVMDDLKTSADTAVSRLLTHAFYTLLPARWARWLAESSIVLPSSVLLANLAGPEAPLQVGGSTVTALFPLEPPPPTAVVSVSVVTYSDVMHVSVACRGPSGDAPARRLMLELRRQLKTLYNLVKNRRGHREVKRPLVTSDGTSATSRPTDELQEKLNLVQDQLHSLRTAGSADQQDGADADEFHQRVATLKEEFRDLLAELQRRRSTPDGSTVVYELDNLDGELRRAKKRPSSSRKMSTSLSSSLSRPLSTAESTTIRSSRSLTSCRSGSPPAEAPRQLVTRESGSSQLVTGESGSTQLVTIESGFGQPRLEFSPPVEALS